MMPVAEENAVKDLNLESLSLKDKDDTHIADELPPENTKEGIRVRIWNHLEKNDLVNFPQPCHRRIPNFKGAEEAANKVLLMEQFKNAKTIKINRDKAQQQARYNVLDAGKRLILSDASHRQRVGLFNDVVPPENATEEQFRHCATSKGMKDFSSAINLDDIVNVDFLITGAVAVSKNGFRIGQGKGFLDLEWAMMCSIKAVNPDTIIVTTVHDDQIRDIPEELIEEHDVPVDFIVTPTQVIECPKRNKPKGIIWSKLTRAKLRLVPTLKKIRDKERDLEIDVTLWDEIEGNETPPQERRSNQRRNNRKSRNTDSEGGDVDDKGKPQRRRDDDNKDSGQDRRPRNQRKRRPRRDSNRSSDDEKENVSDSQDDRPRKNRRDQGRLRKRGPTFGVFVGGLPRALRVSEFKGTVRDHDVDPVGFVWRGGTGHAILLFPSEEEAESALSKLTDMEIKGKIVRVELANRRSGPRSGGEEDDDVNDRKTSDRDNVEPRRRNPRSGRRSPQPDDRKERDGGSDKRRKNPRNRKTQRNRRSHGSSDDEKDSADENYDNRDDSSRKPRRERQQKRGPTFGVFVGGLPRALRVSEFKGTVRDNDVDPVGVVWRGGTGHAILLFPAQEDADAALSKLTDLEIKGKLLRVEMANFRNNKSRSGDEDDGHETSL